METNGGVHLIIHRVPIKRKPIKLGVEILSYYKLQQLKEDNKVPEILDIIKHYDMLARKALNKTGYNSVSPRNPQKHPNWRYFEYLHKLCDIKEWDSKFYIETQFERFSDHPQYKLPYPNMLCSDSGIRYFIKVIGITRQTYKKDVGGRKKEKGKETLSLDDEIEKGILKSVELLTWYLECNKMFEDEAQYKTVKIYQAWSELSPYYLWSIPWFKDVLPELTGDEAEHCRDTFQMIMSNTKLQSRVEDYCAELEAEYGLPANLQLS